MLGPTSDDPIIATPVSPQRHGKLYNNYNNLPSTPIRAPPRTRAESVPVHKISSPFGPSLFASPQWETRSERNFLDSNFYSQQSEEEVSNVARTLDYLGLDDDANDTPPLTTNSPPIIFKQLSPKIRNLNFNFGSPSRNHNEVTINNHSTHPYPGDQVLHTSDSPSPTSDIDGVFQIDNFNAKDPYDNVDDIEGGTIPSRSLWVGNIDSTLSPSDLVNIFSHFGPIDSLRILQDKECAFVNYVNIEDAIKARDGMQNGRVGNCIVKVGFGKINSGSENQGTHATKSLWVGNISPNTDPAELEALFTPFGAVESARVLTHKNCGFVNFVNLCDAIESRKAMNGKDVNGAAIKIGFAKVPSIENLNSQLNAQSQAPIQFNPGFTMMQPTPLKSQPQLFIPQPHVFQYTPQPIQSEDQARVGVQENVLAPYEVPSPLGVTFSNKPPEEVNIYLKSETYATSIPPVPELSPGRRVDQVRLREIRKRLDSTISSKEFEFVFNECIEEAVEFCTDYVGNVVIQKLVEKGTDVHRLLLIEKISPYMAAIGIHKNGTWAVQKLIDNAKTPQQLTQIVNSLRLLTPPLLLDQFGNYVIQCCLKVGVNGNNQFIFDAMVASCWEIAQGRFGARSMRACLESQYTSKRQQKIVASAILQNSEKLVTHPNGALLITWLLDSSSLPGRYRALAPKLAPHVANFCKHKLASATILKIIIQRVELDAREVLLTEIFLPQNLKVILQDQIIGILIIQKIISTSCTSIEEKIVLSDKIKQVLQGEFENFESLKLNLNFKRLLDEISVIPSNMKLTINVGAGNNGGNNGGQEIISPLTPS
ncbi:hypothetical protein HK099_002028, partial [Clydaea vesicula]